MGIAIPPNTVKYHQILYGNQPLKSHLVISCAPPPDSYATEILGIGYNNIEILDF